MIVFSLSDIKQAFVSIAIFNLLDLPVEVLPTTIAYLAMCKVSLRRISNFLGEEELEKYVTRKSDDEIALSIKNKARFVWEIKKDNEEKVKNESNQNNEKSTSIDKSDQSSNGEKKNFELKDIELEVKKGSFVAMIGSVGAGKSSLISAILGEMHLIKNDENVKGEVNISNDQAICYIAQQAWIQNDSFKKNILFGKPFNEQKYREVVDGCALEPDLRQFEAYDETEIGEKGINLSGGQKQRVSLARACYSSMTSEDNKQIILLDDPLSAVDAHVSKHLCDNVLNSKTGLLKNTTRILVTNQLNLLGYLNVDQIVLLRDGKIELKCTYEKFIEMEKNGQLDEYNLRLSQNEQKETETKIEDKDQKSELSDQTDETLSLENKEEKHKKDNKTLIEKEKLEIGQIKLKNYLIYIRNFGIFNVCMVLGLLVVENYFQVYSRVYLADWTKKRIDTDDTGLIRAHNRDNLLIFGGLSFGQCGFNLFANLFITIGAVSTFTLFHKQLLYKILRSPMSFFDTTPIGRILNRFR